MSEPRPLSIAKVLWPYVTLWLVVAAALGVTVVMQITTDRERDLAAARIVVDDRARLLADNVARTLDGIDRTLSVVKAFHERNPTSASLEMLFGSSRFGDDVEHRFALFDRNGRLNTASGTDTERALWTVPAAIDFADVSMYQGSQLRVQRPIAFPETSESVFVPIVKRLDDAGGEFDGVAASALDTSRLLGLTGGPRDHGLAVLGLASTNGEVIARMGSSAPAGERPARDVATLPTIRDNGDATIEWRTLDGRPSLVAIRSIGATGLAAFAGIDEAAVFASNRFFVTNSIGLLVLTLAAVTLPLAFVARRALHELYRQQRRETERTNDRRRARSDPLTGIANDAAFDEHLKNCHLLLARYGKPFVLAFLDVDDFEKINDEKGRDAGDNALRRLARTMRDSVRETDLVARVDGDKFAILMPGARVTSVKRVLDQLRSTLGVDAVIAGWPVTFSVGVVAFESAPPRPIDAANLADSLMHEVKGSGRDGIRYAIYRDHELLNAAHAAA